MSSKTDVQVLLGGKVYTLSGYESEEYLQKIALYINNKMSELNLLPGYKRMGSDMQKILLELNMADDFYKARRRISELETDLEMKDKAEYDLKHELISAQIQLEDATKTVDKLKEDINELQKQIVKLKQEDISRILNDYFANDEGTAAKKESDILRHPLLPFDTGGNIRMIATGEMR